MLAIGSWLTPVNGTAGGCRCRTVVVHGLAVGLHRQQLEVIREAPQVLRVEKYGVRVCSVEIGVPDARQRHECWNIRFQWRGTEVLFNGVEAFEDTHEI